MNDVDEVRWSSQELGGARKGGAPLGGASWMGVESLETGYGDLAVINWCGDGGRDPPSEGAGA